MNFQDKNQHWISMFEASKLCAYSQEYLSLLARRGKIFSKKLGRNWYTTREAVDDYLKTQSIFVSLPKNIFGRFNAQANLVSSLTPEEPEKGEPVKHAEHSKIFEEFEKLNPQVSFGEKKEIKLQAQSVTQSPHLEARLPSEAPINEEKDVLKKLDRLSGSLELFADRVTKKFEEPEEKSLTPEQKEFFEDGFSSFGYRFKMFDRYARSMMCNPVRMTVIMITAIVAIFIIAGGFSFGQVDYVVQQIKKTFKDSDTIQGHFPGTHANEVLVLGKDGNVSIFGHIETQGQLRSYAPDGVAPIVVDSMTLVDNLNANYLDGLASKDFTLAFVTKNGNLTYEDVHLMGDVEVGKNLKVGQTLTVSGATKLLNSLQVYGNLGVFGDAVFGKDVTLTNGNLIIKKGTITISNTSLVKNLNAEFLDGIRKQNINLDFVTSNGASTANGITIGGLEVNGQSDFNGMGFFYEGVWGSDGAFGTLGVAGDVSIGNKDDEDDSIFEVYSKRFVINNLGNLTIDGKATLPELVVSGKVFSDLIPSGSFNLGSSANRWQNLFAVGGNFSGNLTVSGGVNFAGTTSTSFVINTDNTSSDSEDSYLAFERGTTTPNAQLKWNSSLNRFEFNEPVRIASSSATVVFEVSGGAASISNTLYVQSAGNVGIGTSTPSSLLTVQGRGEFQGTASASYLLTGNTLQVGGFASAAYSRFGTGTTTHSGNITTTNDLLISGDLEVDGNAYFDGTVNFNIASASNFYAQPGTAASPSFSFAIDQDTGMFRRAINALGFSTLGAERLTIISDGNVGIGTTTPSSLLTVQGRGEFQGTASASYLLTGNTLQVGGFASAAYSRFGTATTTHSGNITTINDLLISGDLEVDGNAYFDGTVNFNIASASNFYAQPGTAASPSYTFAIDKDTGMFRPAINELGFSTLGVQRMRIDAGGNVGIAQTPESGKKFTVTGDSRFKGSVFINGNGAHPAFWMDQNDGPTVVKLNTDGSSYLNGGNVGIGTTEPGAKLDVVSDVIFREGLQVAGTATASYSRFGTGTTSEAHYVTTTDDLFITGDLEVDGSVSFAGPASISNTLYVSTLGKTGNVGIGTTSPGNRLHVYGENSLNGIIIDGTQSPNLIFSNAGVAKSRIGLPTTVDGFLAGSAANDLTIRTEGATKLMFGTNLLARMTIDAGGNVGIGTTDPSTNTLQVTGSAGKTSGGTAWQDLSDARLKNVLSNLNGSSLDTLMKLRPIKYEWNDLHKQLYGNGADTQMYGFLAQEIKDVIPQMVTVGGDGYYWYNPSGFEAILTAGVQELNSKVASQASEFETLQTQVASLSMTVDQLLTTNNQQSTIGSGSVQVTITNENILSALVNSVLTRVQNLWASGDIIKEGIGKTFFAISNLQLSISNLDSEITNWGTRSITIANTADSATQGLFSGSAAQAADNSKVDLKENGAYLATYGVDSTRGEIQLSGSSQLVAGEARVFFDYSFSSIIASSSTSSIKVITTPTSIMQGQLYVSDKTPYGFVVKELNSQDTGTFDWLVIARRKGFEDAVFLPTPTLVPSDGPTPTPDATVSPSPTLDATLTPTPSPTPTPSESPMPIPDVTVTPTSDITPTPSDTPVPTPSDTPMP